MNPSPIKTKIAVPRRPELSHTVLAIRAATMPKGSRYTLRSAPASPPGLGAGAKRQRRRLRSTACSEAVLFAAVHTEITPYRERISPKSADYTQRGQPSVKYALFGLWLSSRDQDQSVPVISV